MVFLTSENIKEIESRAAETGMTHLRLMENAGSAAARIIRERYEVSGKSICVLCGKGNNGGDGFVIARKLMDAGAIVTAICVADPPATPDATEMFQRLSALKPDIIFFDTSPERVSILLKTADIIVDAIFGYGFSGELKPSLLSLFKYVSAVSGTVVSIDMPSGANCDTGETAESCIAADLTVSFIALKPGQAVYPAAAYCGELIAVPIGVPQELVEEVKSEMFSVEYPLIAHLFGTRDKQAHKGDFGKALLVCGSRDMPGAAVISAKAAVRSGAGIVRLAVSDDLRACVAARLSECVFLSLPETGRGGLSETARETLTKAMSESTACLVGCGLGQGEDVSRTVTHIIKNAECPIVVDADGINAIAGSIDIIGQCDVPVIITPHPGEMARLCGVTAEEIQRSRLKYAAEFARRHGVITVLKGANTLIALPQGRIYFNLTGNAGMATAGTGDMLSGMITAFLAQGFDPEYAAVAGVYLHGIAGDIAASKYSQRAMTPEDMIGELPELYLKMETSDSD